MHPYPLDEHLPKIVLQQSNDHRQHHNNQHRARPRTQSDVIKMLDTEIFHKETLSPFNPLPAIGKKIEHMLEDNYNKDVCLIKPLRMNALDVRSAPVLNSSVDDEVSKIKDVPVLNEINLRNQRLNFPKQEHKEKSVDLLKEIKENKSKMLKRQNTCNVFDASLLFNSKSNTPEKHSPPERMMEKVDDNNNSHQEKPCNPVILGSRVFGMRKRLLERREREFIPIDIAALKENTDLGFQTVKKEQEQKKDFKHQEGPTKMSDLIEMLDSLQNSRKFKETVKKTNHWF